MMLGTISKRVITSTLEEIRGVLPLVRDGLVEEVSDPDGKDTLRNEAGLPSSRWKILYSLPLPPGAWRALTDLSQHVKILLMIDHLDQIQCLEANGPEGQIWDVFVKVDMGISGARRAGLLLETTDMRSLVDTVRTSCKVKLYGFYTHAGHGYRCDDMADAARILEDEIQAVASAANLVPEQERLENPIVLSVGATPTAHAASSAAFPSLPVGCSLELHAGRISQDGSEKSIN